MTTVMVEPGLHVVRIDTAYAPHAEARLQIRAALRELVGSKLGMPAGEVTIRSDAGSAPQFLLNGYLSEMGVSIAHAGPFAFAAFNTRGAVGIDVTPVQEAPNMDQVALDYLGREVRDMLAIVSPVRRADLFAHAWALRQAHLKCLGMAPGAFKALPGNCRVHALAVPDGFVGVLVTPPQRLRDGRSTA
jgi:phosphopantetheinyl transferase